nr:hypothetical protein [Tanacetum cinerariifolium]
QKVCEQPNATASNSIFEINKLKAQLQEKDDTIRHLHAEKDILGLLNVGSTKSSFKTKALETEIAQLKEGFTSLKIHNDGYKVTNTNLNKCYQEQSKANTHLRTTSLEKIATQKAKIATLKADVVGKKNSGPTGTPTKSKNHNPIPAKSVKAKRAADYYRNLYVDISQFMDRSTKSVHTKPHQAKRVVNTSTNAWNTTKNIVARIVPIWKPTCRRFNLHDIFGSRTSTEPIVKPSELTPCVSRSTNATLSLEPILEPVSLPIGLFIHREKSVYLSYGDVEPFTITSMTLSNKQLKEEKKINEKWLTSSKKVSHCISEQIPYQKKKVLGGELFTESSSKMNENKNLFVSASMGYDQEMVPKTKDWVERLNLDNKLPNFNTRRILVPESQAVNEPFESTKTLNTFESSKDFEAESLTPLPPLKNL